VRLGITPKALKRGIDMSYFHDLTTTALNLIDAKKHLESVRSNPEANSNSPVIDTMLELISRCDSIPSCDVSVLEHDRCDPEWFNKRGAVSEESWYLLRAANERQIGDSNLASLVDRAISLCIADQPGSA
jgi:hypothetical protein